MKKDPFTSLHKIKANLPHWAEFKILRMRNGASPDNLLDTLLWLQLQNTYTLIQTCKLPNVFWLLSHKTIFMSYWSWPKSLLQVHNKMLQSYICLLFNYIGEKYGKPLWSYWRFRTLEYCIIKIFLEVCKVGLYIVVQLVILQLQASSWV